MNLLSEDNMLYLIDFITEVLREDDESEPYDEGDVDTLLEIRSRLREML